MLEARRRALSSEEVVAKGREAQKRLLSLSFFQTAQVVGLYAAQAFEVPTSALAAAIRQRGGTVCYPRVVPALRPLTFHAVSSEEALLAAVYGIREPAPSAPETPLQAIDVLVVPGVGFTRDGQRLGRGGGHYDGTLADPRFRGLSVGLAFADCVIDKLPTEGHDRNVNWVVSDIEAVST
ncbi:MAG: 5-formyltetrahydrofolate cyclo-ligase [Myxococcaceae bacterium]|nr:5-formyltetrahydrofolate cyclo-ligase [Myxococcaceae bacterium]